MNTEIQSQRITIDLVDAPAWFIEMAGRVCTAILSAANNLPEPAQAVMAIVDLELEATHEQ